MTYEYLCLFLSFILQLAVLHSEISSPLSTKFSSAETRLNVKSGTSNDVVRNNFIRPCSEISWEFLRDRQTQKQMLCVLNWGQWKHPHSHQWSMRTPNPHFPFSVISAILVDVLEGSRVHCFLLRQIEAKIELCNEFINIKSLAECIAQKCSRVGVWVLSCLLCPTLCDPIDCSPWDSYVHGIFQARIFEWVAIYFSKSSTIS